MISPAEVAKLAHRMGVADRVIEKDYVLSWLLIAIAESDLCGRLAFKGGTALKRIYYPDYRFSEDLDFTLRGELSHHELVDAFGVSFTRLHERVNLILSLRSAEHNAFGSSALLLNYTGPLRGQLGRRHLKVDVTRGERLMSPPADRPLRAPYTDFPKGVRLPTYTLDEILIEKLCALMGRTEPRDLYDVHSLFRRGDVNLAVVPAGFKAKAQHKGLEPTRLGDALSVKADAYERLWSSRLAIQVAELPDVKGILRAVRRRLRDIGLL